MKKKLSLICAAMLTCGLGAVHAQKPGDSFTDRLTNPSFEEDFNISQNRNGEGEEEIGGWTFTWELDAWSNFKNLKNDGNPPKEGESFLDCWCGKITSMDVHQTITGLPVGVYQLSAFVRNIDIDHPEYITDQHVYASIGDKEYVSSPMTVAAFGVTVDAWEELTTELIYVFNETDEVRIGIRSSNDGSNQAGWFQADGFKLVYQGEIGDEELEKQIVEAQLDALRDVIFTYIYDDDNMKELGGLRDELDEVMGTTYAVDGGTIEELRAEIVRIQTAFDKSKAGVKLYNQLVGLISECSTLLNDTEYPGIDDFVDAVEVAQELINNADVTTYENYEDGITELEKALNIYYYTQEASMENPANYSFLVDGPAFWDPRCGLTYDELDSSQESRAIWSNIKSWTNASVGGGDYRTNHLGERPCWNSWSDNFTSMDISQTLTGLKNGYYAVKCYAMTQSDCINDQHAYIKGSAGIAESSIMSIDDGWEKPEGWEELTTGKIAVVDGKLTIGFASTSGGDTKGWFCVTDFTLLYYGEGDMNLSEILTERVKEATDLKSSLNGDRKALEGALAIAEKATTDEEIKAALDTINAGMDIVKASNEKYDQFMEKNHAPAAEAADLLTGKSQEVMNNILSRTEDYLESAIATAEEMTEVYAPALTNYKSYADALAKAEELDTTGAYEGNVEELNSTIGNQTTYLAANIVSKETIDWYIEQLNNNILAVKASILAQEAKAGSNFDFTSLIQNPDAATETGWVINKGTGNTNTGKGQHYSGDGDRRYFDSWNGTQGVLNYTAYQEINFLPNGNYTLKAAGRSTCDNGGAVMFVATGDTPNDTITKGITSNGDVAGEIWEAAVALDPDSEMAQVHPNNETGEFIGYGWNWVEVTFDVKDHKLSIGMSTDSLVTNIPFTGTWFSIADFQLTMNSYGDNGDNFDWITSIEETTTGEAAQLTIRVAGKKIIVTNANGETVNNFKVYNIAGTEVNTTAELNAGIYIVKAHRQVAKVIIK